MAKRKKDELAGFREIFCSFRIDSVEPEVEALLESGVTPQAFLTACQQCMEEIGGKFEAGEYYLPELVVAGEMFKKVSKRIRPHLTSAKSEVAGTIVLGTPKGDIHNLGKDIFSVLAESGGFLVHDLGVDVPPEAFVQKVEETGATILGMSALVTAAFSAMEEVIRRLDQGGLRKKMYVVIGGGVTTKEMVKRMGVDAQTRDAYEGLRIVKNFIGKGG